MAIAQNVQIKIESETATSHCPARVVVYDGARIIAEIIAEVELKQGADGGYYHCVTIRKKDGDS